MIGQNFLLTHFATIRGLGVRGLEVNRRCSGGESNERSTGYLGLGSGLGVPADSTWTDGMRVTARGWGARNLKGVGLPIADSSESESSESVPETATSIVCSSCIDGCSGWNSESMVEVKALYDDNSSGVIRI